MGELAGRSSATAQARPVSIQSEVVQRPRAGLVKFVHDGHVARVGEFPLLRRPIDVTAVMVEMAEAFDEPLF
jgi:hypothetical protein